MGLLAAVGQAGCPLELLAGIVVGELWRMIHSITCRHDVCQVGWCASSCSRNCCTWLAAHWFWRF